MFGDIIHKIRNGIDDIGSFITGQPAHGPAPQVQSPTQVQPVQTQPVGQLRVAPPTTIPNLQVQQATQPKLQIGNPAVQNSITPAPQKFGQDLTATAANPPQLQQATPPALTQFSKPAPIQQNVARPLPVSQMRAPMPLPTQTSIIGQDQSGNPIHATPEQQNQINISNQFKGIDKLAPGDQVHLIDQGIQAGMVDRNKGAQAVQQILSNHTPTAPHFNLPETLLNGGINMATSMANTIARTPTDVTLNIANPILRAMGQPQETPQDVQNNPNALQTLKTGVTEGSTGGTKQMLGDLSQDAILAASPELSGAAEKAATFGTGLVAPEAANTAIQTARLGLNQVANPIVDNAIRYGTGAIGGGLINSGLNSASAYGQGANPGQILKAGEQGALAGTALGVGGEAVGHLAPLAVNAIRNNAPEALNKLHSAIQNLPSPIKSTAMKLAVSRKPVETMPTSSLTSYEGAPDTARVEQYKQAIQNGQQLDPIIAMPDSQGNLGIEDGKHRFEAYKQLGIENVPVKVVTPADIHSWLTPLDQTGMKKIGEEPFSAENTPQDPLAPLKKEALKYSNPDEFIQAMQDGKVPIPTGDPETMKALQNQLGMDWDKAYQTPNGVYDMQKRVATDLYNQAHGEAGTPLPVSQPEAQPAPDNGAIKLDQPTDPLASLKQEALKYNNVASHQVEPISNLQLSTNGTRPTVDNELLQSVKESGVVPVIVDKNGLVLDGEHRITALEAMGEKNVPTIRLNKASKDLTENDMMHINELQQEGNTLKPDLYNQAHAEAIPSLTTPEKPPISNIKGKKAQSEPTLHDNAEQNVFNENPMNQPIPEAPQYKPSVTVPKGRLENDPELQSLYDTAQRSQNLTPLDQLKAEDAITRHMQGRNADAERVALEHLKNGGTRDEAIKLYKQTAGVSEKMAKFKVMKAAKQAEQSLNVRPASANPLLKDFELPKPKEGEYDRITSNKRAVDNSIKLVQNKALAFEKKLSSQDKANLVDYIEGSKDISKAENPKQVQQAVDAWTKASDTVHALGQNFGDTKHIDNFFPGYWDLNDPANAELEQLKAEQAMEEQYGTQEWQNMTPDEKAQALGEYQQTPGAMGEDANYAGYHTKGKVFQTQAEGKDAGYKPMFDNPFDAMKRYFNGAKLQLGNQAIIQGVRGAEPIIEKGRHTIDLPGEAEVKVQPKGFKLLKSEGVQPKKNIVIRSFKSTNRTIVKTIVANPLIHGGNQEFNTLFSAAWNMKGFKPLNMLRIVRNQAKFVANKTDYDKWKTEFYKGGFSPDYGKEQYGFIAKSLKKIGLDPKHAEISPRAMATLEENIRVSLYKNGIERGMTHDETLKKIDQALGDEKVLGDTASAFGLFLHYLWTNTKILGRAGASMTKGNFSPVIGLALGYGAWFAANKAWKEIDGNKNASVRAPGVLGTALQLFKAPGQIQKGEIPSVVTGHFNPLIRLGVEEATNRDLSKPVFGPEASRNQLTGPNGSGRGNVAIKDVFGPAQGMMNVSSGKQSPAENIAGSLLGLYTPHARGDVATTNPTLSFLNTPGAKVATDQWGIHDPTGYQQEQAYYGHLDKLTGALQGDTNALNAANSFLQNDKTPGGQTILKSPGQSQNDWGALANNPKALIEVQKFKQASGNAEPEWNLSPQQLQVWATYKSLAPGDLQKDAIAQQNPWIQQTEQANQDWINKQQFSNNTVTQPGYVPYPKIDPQVQDWMNQAQQISQIPSAQRTPQQIQWLNAIQNDPSVQQGYYQLNAYKEAVRNSEHLPATESATSPDSGMSTIKSLAQAYGLDPQAVLSVAAHEGLSGAVGDNGTSFGPFQMHAGGALPDAIWKQGPQAAQAWAWSPQGIEYAISNMAQSAKGLKGSQAIQAIVKNFEYPTDPQGEINAAINYYNNPGAIQQIANGNTTIYSPQVQDFMNKYMGTTDKNARKNLQTQYPSLYNEMQQAMEQQSLLSANKYGGEAYYGAKVPDTYLSDLYSLGNYDISKIPNPNGTNTYALNNFTGNAGNTSGLPMATAGAGGFGANTAAGKLYNEMKQGELARRIGKSAPRTMRVPKQYIKIKKPRHLSNGIGNIKPLNVEKGKFTNVAKFSGKDKTQQVIASKVKQYKTIA